MNLFSYFCNYIFMMTTENDTVTFIFMTTYQRPNSIVLITVRMF